MAIHDTGMFTVKEINRLKILQDVIDRNLRPNDFDVHQPLENDDDLAESFTWRELRRVSKSLTV